MKKKLLLTIGLTLLALLGCLGVETEQKHAPGTLPPPISSPTPVGEESGSPTPPGEEIAMDWEVYRDDTYGYEIRYPPDYIILEGARQQEPQPLQQVRFQDRELARSDTAAFEPPQFSIEVFDNSSQLPVEQWLEEHGLVGGARQFQMEPYLLAGIQGVRLISPLLFAPNEFFCISEGGYIFKLTPLGKHSRGMLSTFKFTRQVF